MHRFFVEKRLISCDDVLLIGPDAHHIKNVLKLKKGEKIAVLDNDGMEMIAKINRVSNETIAANVESRNPAKGEPQISIWLYQSLLKAGSFENVIQKCTEIGVSRFVPVICERCVAKVPADGKMTRWRKVAQQAAEQSGRGKIPAIENPVSFDTAYGDANGLSIMPWESERTQGIKTILHKHKENNRINIFIGPEGGFSKEEVDKAVEHDIISVSLGRRTLRAETAGAVAASVVCYEFNEMDV